MIKIVFLSSLFDFLYYSIYHQQISVCIMDEMWLKYLETPKSLMSDPQVLFQCDSLTIQVLDIEIFLSYPTKLQYYLAKLSHFNQDTSKNC